MTKHTPGPWDFIVLEDYDLEGITFENGYVKSESYFICEIIEWNATAEDVANARLIAAAPEQNTELLAIRDDRRLWDFLELNYPERADGIREVIAATGADDA